MINDNYYPDFDLGSVRPFQLAFDQMLNDPLWLERDGCPYDRETVEALRGLWLKLRAKPDAAVRAVVAGEDKWDQVSGELTELFNDLREFSGQINADDVKDRMAYFRTATSLLDKIVGLQERANNVKAVSDFQKKVMDTFEQVLSPEQRTRAMELLEKS